MTRRRGEKGGGRRRGRMEERGVKKLLEKGKETVQRELKRSRNRKERFIRFGLFIKRST